MSRPGVGTIYKRNGLWYLNYTSPITGKRVRESTGGSDKFGAQELLQKRLSGQSTRSPNISDLMDSMFQFLEIKGIKSLVGMKRHAKDIYKTFGSAYANQLTTTRIQAYQSSLLSQGYKKATINRRLQTLRRALNLAYEEGKVDEVVKFRMLPEYDNVRTGFLDEKDVLKVAECASRDYARHLILFAFYSAWRKGTIISLTWKDVDIQRKVITIPGSKNKNNRVQTMPLTGKLLEIIQERWKLKSGDYVFHVRGNKIVKLHRSLKTCFVKAGFPDDFFHNLRRSGIRYYRNVGIDPTTIMKISGHRSPNVFQRYNIVAEVDISDAIERAEEFYKEKRKKDRQDRNEERRERSRLLL